MIRVVARYNPLESSVVYCDIDAGRSLAEIVGQKNERIYATVNAVPIPLEAWDSTYPVEGEIVVLVATPQVFIPAIIATIVAAAQTAGAAAALAVAGAMGVAASGSVVAGVVGALVTGLVASVGFAAALAPMILPAIIRPQIPTLRGAGNTSNRFFSLTQGSNSANPYGIIPKLYGSFRITPPTAGNYFTEIKDNNQFLHVLVCLGHGPLKIGNYIVGPEPGQSKFLESVKGSFDVGDPTAILVGNTPINELVGVTWQIGTAEAIMNPGAFGSAKNQRLYTQDVEEDNLSYAMPLTADAGYSDAEDAWKEDGTEWVHTSHTNPTEISFDLVFPALYIIAGKTETADYDTGIRFRVRYKRTGTAVWRGATLATHRDGYPAQWEIYTLRKEPIRRTNSFDVLDASGNDYLGTPPLGTTYDVEVTRLSTFIRRRTQTIFADATWAVMRSVKSATYSSAAWNLSDYLNAKDVILMAARIRATGQLSGSLETITVKAQSVLPVWNNGSLSLQPTSNPAWIYADILRGNQLQAKSRLAVDQIDWPALKEWADWCDAGADNKAFEYNWYHLDEETMLDRLRAVASTGRASWALNDTRFSVIRDNNFTPVQLISPRNSRNFELTKNYPRIPHALRVRYISDQSWQQDEAIVLDDGYYKEVNGRYFGPLDNELSQADALANYKYPELFETLETQGVTNKVQAMREGRYHLASLRLRRETYKVEMDFENLVAQRGDCVLLAHDALLRGRAAGRIQQIINGTQLILDEEVDLTPDPAGSFCLRVRRSDNSIVLLNLAPGTGPTHTVVTLTNGNLSPGDLFVFGPVGTETLLAKIAQVDYSPDLSATLTLVPAAPGILTADEGSIQDDGSAIPDTPPELRTPLTPTFVSLSSNPHDLQVTSKGLLVRVNVQWAVPASVVRTDSIIIHYSINGQDWQSVTRDATLYTHVISDVPDLTPITVYLQAYNQTSGKYSAPTESRTITTPGAADVQVQPPTDLDLLPANYITADGVVHYEIRVAWLQAGISNGYDVQWQPLAAAAEDWQGITAPGETPQFTIKDIQPATYRVRVRNRVKLFEQASTWLQGEVTVGVKDVPPQPPTQLTAVSTSAGVDLNWVNPPDPDLAAIQVFESLYNNRATASKIAEVLSTHFFRPLTDVALRYYWLRALDSSGNVSTWEPTNALAGVEGRALGLIGDNAPPPAPASLTLTASTWQVDLAWAQASEIVDLVGTEVWVSTTNDRTTAAQVVLTRESFYTHLRRDTDTTYYYWIRNLDVEGYHSEWYPADASAGAAVTVPKDPSEYLKLLDGEVLQIVEVPGETIAGVFFPPGVYIRNAMIADGSLEGVKIKADSITADKIDTRGLDIRDEDGTVILGAGTDLDLSRVEGAGAFAALSKLTAGNISSYLDSAAITNAYIGDVIQSADFLPGQQGWRLNKAGDIEVHNLNARGTVSSSLFIPGQTGWRISEDGSAEFNNGVFHGTLAASTLLAGVDYTLQDLLDQVQDGAIAIVGSGQYFKFDADNNCTSQQTLYFTANNATSTTWAAVAYPAGATLGTSLTLGTSAGGRTLSASQMTAGSTLYERVEITASNGSSTDKMVVYRLSDGNPGLVGWLTNGAVNLSADSSGNVLSYAAAVGQYRVFLGLTEVTAACTFSLASSEGMTTQINDSAGTEKGYYLVSAMAADTGTADLRATYQGVHLIQTLSVTRVRAGIAGPPGANGISPLTLSSSAVYFGYDYLGNLQGHDTIELLATGDNAGLAQWTATPFTEAGVAGAPLSLSGSGVSRTLSAALFGSAFRVVVQIQYGSYSDQETIVRLTDGGSALSGYLTNDTETLAADPNGVVDSYTGATGSFKVFYGTLEVSSECSFSIENQTGLPAGAASISATGEYSVTLLAADTATVVFKATHPTGAITKSFGLYKAKRGSPALAIDLSNDSHTVATEGDGSGGDYSQVYSEARIYEGLSDVSDSWSWQEPTLANGGLSGGISGNWSPATRRFTVTGMTGDTGTVVFRASRIGYPPQTATFSVAKAKGGEAYYLVVESSNGTVFHPGQGRTTLLKARLFLNGEEVTAETPAAWFSWQRVSVIPRPAPNDDTTWNAAYASGYKQIQVSVDDVNAQATFFCNILSP